MRGRVICTALSRPCVYKRFPHQPNWTQVDASSSHSVDAADAIGRNSTRCREMRFENNCALDLTMHAIHVALYGSVSGLQERVTCHSLVSEVDLSEFLASSAHAEPTPLDRY